MKKTIFILIAALFTLSFTACDSKVVQETIEAATQEQHPGDVVTEIFTALSDGDVKGAIELSCINGKLPTVEQKNTTIKALEQTHSLFKGVRVEIEEEKIKDNTAYIKTKIKMGTEDKKQDFKAYKINGKWYIEL